MKKSRFTESQIVAILKELDAGTSATELCCKWDGALQEHAEHELQLD